MRSFHTPFIISAAALLSVAAAAPSAFAGGDPAVYTSQAAFTSAVSGGTTITFENLAAPGGYVSYSANAPLTVNGVTFTGQSTETKNGVAQAPATVSYAKDRDESSGAWRVDGTDSYLGGGTYTANPNDFYTGVVTLTFDQSYTAFGTQIGTNRDASQTVQISLYNGTTLITAAPTTLALAYNPASPQYIGFVGTQGFNKVVITGTSGSVLANPNAYIGSFTVLDNVRVGNNIAAVPEPGAWATLLSIAGMTGLGVIRGRLRYKDLPQAPLPHY